MTQSYIALLVASSTAAAYINGCAGLAGLDFAGLAVESAVLIKSFAGDLGLHCRESDAACRDLKEY